MIYAEMTRKQMDSFEGGNFVFPLEVVVTRRSGSRFLYMECDSRDEYDGLTEYLDSKGVNWQEV